MQRVALMKPFDQEYYKEEFRKVSEDFAIISVFGIQLDHADKFEWNSLRDYWIEIRNVVAKYLDNTKDVRLVAIDHKCNFMSLRRLPKITFTDRPQKPLPREWWDSNPEREESLENIAVNWWMLARVPPCKYEDFATPDTSKVEEEINLIEDVDDEEDVRGVPGTTVFDLTNERTTTFVQRECIAHGYAQRNIILVLNSIGDLGGDEIRHLFFISAIAITSVEFVLF